VGAPGGGPDRPDRPQTTDLPQTTPRPTPDHPQTAPRPPLSSLQTVGGGARAGLLNAVGGCNGTNATTMAPAPEAETVTETQMYPPVAHDEKPAGAGHEGRNSPHVDRSNPDEKRWDSVE
jgi:hypothetical protein